MRDTNLFENSGKAIRRAYEAIEDASVFAEEIFCHSFPQNSLLGSIDCAGGQAKNIFIQSVEALQHEDTIEAAHQLHRQIYFCSIEPKLKGSSDEKAAQAALAALEHHKSANEIERTLYNAWIYENYSKPLK